MGNNIRLTKMLTCNKIQAALGKIAPVKDMPNSILLPSFCEAYVELHPEIITYLVGKDCKIEYYSLPVTGEEENKIIASIKEQALAKRQLDYSSIQPE